METLSRCFDRDRVLRVLRLLIYTEQIFMAWFALLDLAPSVFKLVRLRQHPRDSPCVPFLCFDSDPFTESHRGEYLR